MGQKKANRCMALLKVLRPWQWTKNSFILASLLFSGQFTQLLQCLKTALAFAAFCAISSAMYIVNDVCDRREDRLHPVKKYRPIASGAIEITPVLILALALIVIGLVVSVALNKLVLLIVVMYLIITIIYSLGLKHVVILDVMSITTGFVLRILCGSAAIAVIPSHWLILCTIMISLFLGFAKRRSELVTVLESTESAGPFRIVLGDYNLAFLDQAIAVVAAATIICYALYTVDIRTQEVFGTRAMVITVPCVIYGLLRYIHVIYHLRQGEEPIQILLKDVPIIVNIIIWVALSLCIIIYGDRLALFAHLSQI